MMFITNHHTPFRDTVATSRQRRKLSHLLRKNNQRSIYGNPTTVLQTLRHAECFKTWASTSHTESIVRCAYCRTIYHYENKCFLCLNTIHDENLACTNCCHTKIHSNCSTDLADLILLLPYEFTLECGQLADCNRYWVDV